MKQISILGCGWLGIPLAKALIEEGFAVKGSTTSERKIELLKNSGITPFIITLKAESAQGNIGDFLKDSEILIIDIPPKLRSIEKENFVAKIEILIPYIEASSIKKVLFVSSTSVYADDNSVVTEATPPNPDTESGKQLLASEILLRYNCHFKTTVLRFSGLVGEDRHPVCFLAGRDNIENPEGPVNLIHQHDCIRIIMAVLKQDCWQQTFNAAAPFHPLRKDYYTKKAIQMDLPPPLFKEGISIGKTIDATAITTVLKHEFIARNLYSL